jgi:hypothetical protein
MNGTNSAVVTLARVLNVEVTEDTLSVDLEDGRTVSVPIGWYPRLASVGEGELCKDLNIRGQKSEVRGQRSEVSSQDANSKACFAQRRKEPPRRQAVSAHTVTLWAMRCGQARAVEFLPITFTLTDA